MILVDTKPRLPKHAFRSKCGDFFRAVSQLSQPAVGILRQSRRRTLRPDRIVWELKSSTRDVLRAIRVLECRKKVSFSQMSLRKNLRNTQDAACRDTCRYHQPLPFRRTTG